MPRDNITIGFIGIGLMGRPIVSRLLDHGYFVRIWNRSPDKTAPLIDKGAKAESCAAYVARSADIIMLCLADDAAVEQVALAPAGIAEGGKAGALIVDFSTVSPATTRKLAQAVKDRAGIEWVDAPVSGGVPGAEEGTLAIMCGGKAEQVARIRPILDCLAARVTHMGPVGSGQITKICNQLIVSSNLVAIAEAIEIGQRAGIDVTKLSEAIAGGWADSRPLQIFGPRMATLTDTPKMGAISTMLKDTHSIMNICEDYGFDAQLAKATHDIYRTVADAGFADADLSCLANYCAKLN